MCPRSNLKKEKQLWVIMHDSSYWTEITTLFCGCVQASEQGEKIWNMCTFSFSYTCGRHHQSITAFMLSWATDPLSTVFSAGNTRQIKRGTMMYSSCCGRITRPSAWSCVGHHTLATPHLRWSQSWPIRAFSFVHFCSENRHPGTQGRALPTVKHNVNETSVCSKIYY